MGTQEDRVVQRYHTGKMMEEVREKKKSIAQWRQKKSMTGHRLCGVPLVNEVINISERDQCGGDVSYKRRRRDSS